MGATFFLHKMSRPKTGSNKPPSQGVLGVHSLRVNRQMREADHSPTPSNEKKNVWSYSSNPHVPSRREQLQLHLCFTTNEEHGRSLQRSSSDCCKSRSSHVPPSSTAYPAGCWDTTLGQVMAICFKMLTYSRSIFVFNNSFQCHWFLHQKQRYQSHYSQLNQSIKIWSTSTSITRARLQIEHMKMTSALRALNFYFLHNFVFVLSQFCYFAITTQSSGFILHNKANMP